ncbi:CaiB/BaiF CoA transferase family protein [Limobrevibacterium gyesilva]|uniref:CoA transferase n=1 Tax=Limobrevibacterium gyesilva TaxID=2991712 RepID=A0AA42CHG4_9PROT|nr:CoA transferase [Limobrevibacterium gyesilva]MCW3477226.1 CoA transferase [Limobrevibacterium gyesilva]
MQKKPLAGVRILDFTRLFAGPFCTMLLADLGADVVKVEAPEGDPIRMQGPPFHDGASMGYLAVNRNKRSIVLNTKERRDRELAHALACKADVVVENFRPGVMERMGLDYRNLAASNPTLIYASLSGMGATGPCKDKGAFDLTIQAEGGYMSLTGERNGNPIKLGTSAFDLVCGQYAMGAIMTALFDRERTGRGQRIETSLFEGVVSFLVDAGLEWLLTGHQRPKWGSEHASSVPYKAFEAADGWVVIGAGVERLYAGFVRVLGREDLVADPRFSTLRGRVTHRDALHAILDAEVRKWRAADLIEKLQDAGVPCAPVNTMEQVFRHPQTLARGMRVMAPKTDGGEMPLIGPAVKYGNFDVAAGWTAPPKIGEHTDEVLQGWLDVKAGGAAAG